MIAAYVSGHGFGHATRVGEVLRCLRRRAPGLAVSVVSTAPESLFARIPGGVAYRRRRCDVGLSQKGALVIDEGATVEALRAFRGGFAALVEEEARWLREQGARVVLGDIPPLAFEAAFRAGVPSLGLANFSWDWIYRHLGASAPALLLASAEAAVAYGRAGLLLELPFAGDLGAFPRRKKIPLVARKPTLSKAEARRRLASDGRPLVLLSFGGAGLPGFDPSVLEGLPGYQFAWPGAVVPAGVLSVAGERLDALGLAYPDVVCAADVVVTKPGYGIVTDAIGARTRLVYTDRGDFPEYPILVREMASLLPARYVGPEDLRAGRLGPALGAVLGAPFPASPDLSGAEHAASAILAAADGALEGAC